MKLTILFLSIMSMVYIMWETHETGEIDLDKALILAVDMFSIIAISTKLI